MDSCWMLGVGCLLKVQQVIALALLMPHANGSFACGAAESAGVSGASVK